MGDYGFFAAKITEKQKKRGNLLQEKYNNDILKGTQKNRGVMKIRREVEL